MFIKHIKIRSYEMGLYFRDGEFRGLLAPGRHWLFDPSVQGASTSCRSASVAGAREARRDRRRGVRTARSCST